MQNEPAETMTIIEPEIAGPLLEEIKDLGEQEYAESMGLGGRHSTEIEKMTAEEIAEAAKISIEWAETLMAAVAVADEPSLWGASQVLFRAM